MDYETLSNCFVGVFEHYKTEERHIFTIHKSKNDLVKLLDFLDTNIKNKEWHISFNGLGFDSQITEHLIRDQIKLKAMTGDGVARYIYGIAQDVIARQSSNEFLEFSEKNLSILQVDVFKLNHWDNPAKRSSLKWIQYSMDWYNIQDMPIHHNTEIETEEQLNIITSYCINDVKSTKQILHISKDQVALRKSLTQEYNIPLFSASEPRIAKELFLLFLSKATGMKKWDIKQLRTNRDSINVKDIILPYIKYTTPEFQTLLSKFQSVVINPNQTKGGFKYSLTYKGVNTDFGLGGVHGASTSGIYKAGNGMIIMTSDVTSFYPNLGIRNKWSPAHLPKEEFCELYEWFFEERKKIPKKDPRNYVYKIILNSTYGLSNDKNSFLYDPEFTMRITINGQLLLMKLYEMLSTGIPESVPIMQNTDGLEMMIPADKKDKYLSICKEWEELTNLQLEHDEYQKLILADVNNYIAVYKYKEVSKEDYLKLKKNKPYDLFKIDKGRFLYAATKCKGRFEFADLALHKNKSFLIIPKAIFNFLVHDIMPEQTLMMNKNIFDYCGGVKIKGEWEFKETCVINQEVKTIDLQSTLRYFISNKGCKIMKCNKNDGRQIQLESGQWLQTTMNIYVDLKWEDYDINEKYYLQNIYKEIHNIKPVASRQTSLQFID
jgi:hypothetical protein